MLIRNASVKGYGLVDLRLMHGAVQEIGVGLQKGLYESEIDLCGDMLTVCPPEMPLPKRFAGRGREGASARIEPGSREPFLQKRGEEIVRLIHQHSGD